ncbi:hypothetical protein [Mycobacterium syngnathidarum]
MTDGAPKQPWQHAWDYGIETGRYILVGERGEDWQNAVLHPGPNFDTAPLHTDPRIAVHQQILDNIARAQRQRQEGGE